MTSFDDLLRGSLRFGPFGYVPRVTEEAMDADRVQTLRRLFDEIVRQQRPAEGEAGFAATMARLVGGELLRVTAGPNEDTQVEHGIQGVPRFIPFSWAIDGRVGRVVGSAEGGASSPGDPLNETPWTRTELFVRATREADYVMVIV